MVNWYQGTDADTQINKLASWHASNGRGWVAWDPVQKHSLITLLKSIAEEMPGKGKYAELTKISASRVKKIMQTNDEV